MPDHDLTPEVLPEIPAQNIQQNESIPKSQAAASTSITEKIGRAAAGVFERHGIPFRKGRGRPRKDGSPGAADVPLETVPSPAPSADAVVPPVADTAHGELFRRSVASAVRGLLTFAKNLVRKKASQAGIDREFSDKALRECEPEPEVLNDFSESLEIVLKKYNVKTDYAPEIALAVSVGRLASPYVLLLQTFNAEIERRKRLENRNAKQPGQ